jgi:trimeric autotransporter adhesin
MFCNNFSVALLNPAYRQAGLWFCGLKTRNCFAGSNNTELGYFAHVSSGSLTNATVIGANAIVNASNKVRIGNSAVTVIEGQVAFSFPSDGRFKFNIREDVSGLDFIIKLRPITYQFDVKRFD